MCAVNGPAIGIAVTLLGLADQVYVSDKATFHTPFTSLGQTPEGCSSYTFPKIMGPAKANELLLAGRKLNATEAYERGLVTDIFPHSDFHTRVEEKTKFLASLPQQAMMYTKALYRGRERDLGASEYRRMYSIGKGGCQPNVKLR